MSSQAGNSERLSTGIGSLDAMLGGGLLPGTLTVVVGATGIGKTQLGLQFAEAGLRREGRRGVVFDMNARIDAQSHETYALRMFDWQLRQMPADEPLSPAALLEPACEPGDYLHVFDRCGRKVARRDLDFDAWHDWQAQLAAKLQVTIGFFYGHFIRGVERVVVDGVEPADRAGESIQFELFEYVYHQILRKEFDWVARDLFRQDYRAHGEAIAAQPYDFRRVACVLLYTSQETMLEQLIERPLAEGDVLANANTLIYMGKIRERNKLVRALHVAKHRGSTCGDEIVPYAIGDRGIQF